MNSTFTNQPNASSDNPLDTTTKMKSVKQQALEAMDLAGLRLDQAHLKWVKNPSEENLRVLEARGAAYRQTVRTYQAACLVVKHNHGRMETVRIGVEVQG